ncbi:hypothetical protein, partial [Halothiobacillus sp.]|uniref:hypothetical protein n=1 Tax=Halothiobacillus sp. TaxID=1891311 RepID=UPI0026024306
MKLTLSDLASGPLKEFVGQLDLLSTKITALNEKFVSFSAASKTFNQGIGNSSRSVSALAGNTDRLQASLATMTERLTTAIDGMITFSSALSEAKAASSGLGGEIKSVNSGLAATSRHANRATDSFKAMAQAWSALKINKEIKGAVVAGSDYQATQTRLANLNVPGADVAIGRAANQAAKAVPQMSREQTLSMGIDLVNATGSVEHAVTMLKPFAQAMFNMKIAMPTGKRLTEGDMLSVAKALEQRGVTMDPAKMQTELDYFSKIIAATQGRVGPQQLLGNINYSKGGLGLTMEDKFLPIFASLIERQGTGSGGHGGQVGTALTSLQQAVVG